MLNQDIINLLHKIKSFPEFQNTNFTEVLRSYNITQDEFDAQSTQINNNIENIDDVLSFFSKDEHNYFTISSKDDFNDLTEATSKNIWDKTLIYHPLNDHSRKYLSKGDVLFCYRQGQFSSLDEALDTRGIYAIGIAATDPMILYPSEEGYKQYGIVVCFPILLNQHLELRNIQMNPDTIALTPYNGNRNDALQHIPSKVNYESLMGMLFERNKELTSQFQKLLGSNLTPKTLPTQIWGSGNSKLLTIRDDEENNDFDIEKFILDISKTGLIFSDKVIYRFVSSLLSKRFLLLTGLSGSGKTKLAQSFVKWITGNNSSLFNLLKEALQSERIITNYKIHSVSPNLIELINISGSTGKIIPLPTLAIYEWYNCFVNGEISNSDDPKEKRHEIGDKSIYQKYLHGFYSELFKISSVMYDINKKVTENSTDQYKLISVGADWTNRDQLIGFPNAINQEEYIFPDTGALNLILDAINNPSYPFFLILDEMNMSHVERYFSDFLSAMESNDKVHLHDKNELLHILPKNIPLPKNLFIIGTVNIDETTYMFSPKVLDRANVLEFRVDEDEMKTFFNNMQEIKIDILSGEGFPMSRSFLDLSQISVLDDSTKLRDELIPFFNKLQEAGAEFGYRTASEISTFIKKCSNLVNKKMTRDEIVDAAIMQKLLPKLHGSRNRIDRIIKELGKLCLQNSDNQDMSESDPHKIKYPVSYEKLKRMHKRVISDGFTSYAEA